MAIDEGRYNEYRSEVNDYISGLSLDEQLATVETRLLDYMARNNVGPNETLRLQRITRQFFDDGYVEFIDQIFERYEDTVQLVNDVYQDLGLDIGRDLDSIQAIEQTTRQELGRYRQSTIDNITSAVRKGLVEGDSVNELQQRIKPASKKAGLHSRTIAKTQIKTYGRSLKVEKARKAQVPYFEYVGIVRDVTRPFCRAMAGTTHHIDSIRKMRNGNREPVLHNCGGWNCVHDWEPDPFADSESDGELFTISEGSSELRLRGTQLMERRYERAKELNSEARE